MASVANEKKKLAEARAALGDSYVPDENEEYMNQRQQDYFRMLLLDWKKSIHDAAGQTLQDRPYHRLSANGTRVILKS